MPAGKLFFLNMDKSKNTVVLESKKTGDNSVNLLFPIDFR